MWWLRGTKIYIWRNFIINNQLEETNSTSFYFLNVFVTSIRRLASLDEIFPSSVHNHTGHDKPLFHSYKQQNTEFLPYQAMNLDHLWVLRNLEILQNMVHILVTIYTRFPHNHLKMKYLNYILYFAAENKFKTFIIVLHESFKMFTGKKMSACFISIMHSLKRK